MRQSHRFNPQTGKYEIKIKLTKPLPIEARGIVADALRSFRNALDQAVFAATVVIKGKGNRRCHFPSEKTPTILKTVCPDGRLLNAEGSPRSSSQSSGRASHTLEGMGIPEAMMH